VQGYECKGLEYKKNRFSGADACIFKNDHSLLFTDILNTRTANDGATN